MAQKNVIKRVFFFFFFRSKPFIAERFELFAAGMELANAYTEQNDPTVQREMFRRSEASADEEERETADDDYLEALEYGLPPTGGFGMGLDRLVMLMANQNTIKEVVAFPAMKPKPSGEKDSEE